MSSTLLNRRKSQLVNSSFVTWCVSVRSSQRAFTLVELLVVMFIIGLLAALVAPNFIGKTRDAERKAAVAQIANLSAALDMFRLDVGRYPNSQEGLEALHQRPTGIDRWDGPYLKKAVPLDPWGKAYLYRSPGENGPFDLFSYGPDGAAGGSEDNADIAG
jgi:general secretion pathway protein G